MKREDIYFRAMQTRDHRFDGKFFIGVKTTGIYCRPICPARPKRENVEFFRSRLEAEKAGYRPCLRCRPESAPQSSAWIGKSALVRRAVKVLSTQQLLEFNEDRFAANFGVSARHLRRLFQEEIGKTPKQISFENRLNLARQLLTETRLSIADVAFASGFLSIRRFNDTFKMRFKRTPSECRRNKVADDGYLTLSLAYRPPFDFEGLLNSYQNHRVGSLEHFDRESMSRIIKIGDQVGRILISNNSKKSCLILKIDFADRSKIYEIISRVRTLFDLDSDPVVIANSLEQDSKIKQLLEKYPGIRLPSGWDPFEIAISAILGQLVSLERGRSLVHDLIELAGQDSGVVREGRAIKIFPTPQEIANANLQSLKTTKIRKQTLIDFSKAILEKKISLEPTQDVEEFLKKVMSIRGIGPWTANYMALKVLRDTNTFPATDLILGRALEIHTSEVVDRMSPWRAYVAALFWRNYAEGLKKKRSQK